MLSSLDKYSIKGEIFSHKLTFVPDTPIESRARLSLPKQLVLRQSMVGADVGKTLGTIKLDQSLFFLCRVEL